MNETVLDINKWQKSNREGKGNKVQRELSWVGGNGNSKHGKVDTWFNATKARKYRKCLVAKRLAGLSMLAFLR